MPSTKRWTRKTKSGAIVGGGTRTTRVSKPRKAKPKSKTGPTPWKSVARKKKVLTAGRAALGPRSSKTSSKSGSRVARRKAVVKAGRTALRKKKHDARMMAFHQRKNKRPKSNSGGSSTGRQVKK